uniref:Uncharacterized protein n=1 Tax=Physcomitrium patens TaxID=3218 RepID=A0A2K1KEU1_PHYPA|nr:hypothetical protein PHYPA_008670 [Physcomitrium patens]
MPNSMHGNDFTFFCTSNFLFQILKSILLRVLLVNWTLRLSLKSNNVHSMYGRISSISKVIDSVSVLLRSIHTPSPPSGQFNKALSSLTQINCRSPEALPQSLPGLEMKPSTKSFSASGSILLFDPW